jgi:hemerythrin-like domain-containing protein
MKNIHVLRSERDALRTTLDRLEKALTASSLDTLRESLSLFEAGLQLYCRKLQKVLFPVLSNRLSGRAGAFAPIAAEGGPEQRRLGELRNAVQANRRGEFAYHGRLFVDLLREHLWWFDDTLIPLAERHLSAKDWDRVRRGFDEMSLPRPDPVGLS